MSHCARCEALLLTALDSSTTYHALLGDLEAAYIRGDAKQPFRIQRRIASALRLRDDAIKVLSEHESVHAKERLRPARVAALGC